MPLKAKPPKKGEAPRLKALLYGPAGIGKTVGLIHLFPRAVIIDTEGGCSHYSDLISKQGSVLLQTNEIEEIVQELRTLATEDHDFTSVLIDPVTKLYESIQDKWDDIHLRHALKRGEREKAEVADWGPKYWGKIKREMKRILNLIERIDMNVVMSSHQKDMYQTAGGSFEKVGVTFDGMKGLDYFFSFIFRMYMSGPDRWVAVDKQRAFPRKVFDDDLQWDPDAIRKAWGVKAIERKADKIELATTEQVRRIQQLIELLQISEETQSRWHSKAKAEAWEDFARADMEKCIQALEKQLQAA